MCYAPILKTRVDEYPQSAYNLASIVCIYCFSSNYHRFSASYLGKGFVLKELFANILCHFVRVAGIAVLFGSSDGIVPSLERRLGERDDLRNICR